MAKIESSMLAIPRTQSSANAKAFKGFWPYVLTQLNLLKWQRRGLIAKLYKIGDKGSPCLSPR